jgi:hypothetical protein
LFHLEEAKGKGKLIVYKVFYKDYDRKKGVLLGKLTERRKDLRGKTQLESGLRWAILTFGAKVKDKNRIFIVPEEVKEAGDNGITYSDG